MKAGFTAIGVLLYLISIADFIVTELHSRAPPAR